MMAGCGIGSARAQAPAPHSARSARIKATPIYHLLGFQLSGTDRVDTDALIAALPQHKGDRITHEQIKDDADSIRAALKARHVHGDMTTATLERDGPGHDILVVWDIHLLDVLSYTPTNEHRHFLSQTFSGNTALTAGQLAESAGLKPGQDMPDGSISDARTGIEQAYDKALPGKTVDVTGKVTLKKDKTVLIDWHITEHK